MFSKQVVWITGASSGIGETLAVQFAIAGSNLVLSARRQAELERVQKRCIQAGLKPDQVMVLPLDVTDFEAMNPAVGKVQDYFGKINFLINNAGIAQRSPCVDTELKVYRRLLEVNVLGQIALTKAVLPVMLAQQSGHIAVTSSVAGKMGSPQRTAYCASKHAVLGFFNALREEVDELGIRVTTIIPGYIKTGITEKALTGDGSPFGIPRDNSIKSMDADLCATAILQGFRRGDREIMVGLSPEMTELRSE